MSLFELCECGDGFYDAEIYQSCFECFIERRQDYDSCIYCGRWHSPRFETCYRCRWTRADRDEAARALRAYVMWRDDCRCRECSSRDDLQIDHIKPCRSGGDASLWNLQVLCRRCNLDKGDTWIPGGRLDRFRQLLIGYYFFAGRGWLDTEQRAALRVEVEEIRSVRRLRRGARPASHPDALALTGAVSRLLEAFPGATVCDE